MAWDSVYESEPTNSTYVADTDDSIRNLKVDIRARVAKEHGFNLTESGAQTGHGKHLRGSARAFVSDTSVADPSTVTTDDADYATGRLQVYPTLKRLGYYSGSAWIDLIRNSSGQLFSEVATGTAPMVVASTTEVANLRAATASSALTLNGKTASETATADTILLRDAAGRGKVVAPSASSDIALLSTVTGWTEVVDFTGSTDTLYYISLNVGETKVYAWLCPTPSSGDHKLGCSGAGTYRGVFLQESSSSSVPFALKYFSRVNSTAPLVSVGMGQTAWALVVVKRVA